MGADHRPPLEPPGRRARVNTRSATRDALVLLVVVEAVDERIADLARTREIATVVAIGPNLTASAAQGGVEQPIRADREALHAAREGALVVRLDDEVQVVVLHG